MIIATSGHIDHGKTLLVRALTGIDTDRLPEEKRRGISVDLGFAYYRYEDETTLGFVDVPGHERFIRNMIAGATSIDFALLVIAADDGPMPQTKEHLEILNLLRVTSGVCVITKIDKVGKKRLKEVSKIVQKFLDDTYSAGMAIFPVSSSTKQGIDELLAHLKTCAQTINKKNTNGNFRFSIDRSFTIQGTGVVVTGSVRSGIVNIGDNLILSPSGRSVRIRGIQSQKNISERGLAGQRCALNISGPEIGLKNVRRGDWILEDRVHRPTDRLDANLIVAKNELKALKHWTPVHIHLGAGNVTGRVAILENRELMPGNEGFVQIVTDEPVCTVFGDRFIIRDRSASRVIGGGKIIDPFSRARGRANPNRIEWLKAMSHNSNNKALRSLLVQSSEGLNLGNFSAARNLTKEESKDILSSSKIKRVVDGLNEWGFTFENWNFLLERMIRCITSFHERNPNLIGLSENEIEKNLNINLPTFIKSTALKECIAMGKLKRSGRYIVEVGHSLKLSRNDQIIWGELENMLIKYKFSPPVVHDLASYLGMELKALERLLVRFCDLGLLVKFSEKRYFLSSSIMKLVKIIELTVKDDNAGHLDLKKFRDKTGMGRNIAVDVLDFFDKSGFTRRGEKGRFIKKPFSKVSLFNRSSD